MDKLQYTTPACKRALPQSMVAHLWGLAQHGTGNRQTFILKERVLGVGRVQEILHRAGGTVSWSRVFGCAPTEAAVVVYAAAGGGFVMDLAPADEPAAPAFGQAVPCRA